MINNLKKILFIVPIPFFFTCTGGTSLSKQITAAIDSECGEKCIKEEMMIKSDTIISKSVRFDKRILENINKIEKGMPVPQLVGLVGPADCDCGCGIHILVYVLQDESCYHVGTDNEKVLFVKCVKAKPPA
ncbi:MAG: hypothetical protein JXA71_01315 [Chitinispirillaceae bacterium]|nr:hypothetical protein [Chitinispirillaceae bacterium]